MCATCFGVALGLLRWAQLLAPEHSAAVDVHNLRGDSVFGAVISDSLPAVMKLVIVNDAKAARRQSRVEPVQRLNRRFIQVTIETQYRGRLERRILQGV